MNRNDLSAAPAIEQPSLADARSQAEVCIVDDDPEVRSSLSQLLASVGLRVRSFGSAEEFLKRSDPERPGE